MPSNAPFKSKRAACRRSGVLRMLAGEHAGFSIIEVMIAAVIVVAISGGVATALVVTATVSGDQRRHSQANELAQQDQERLKGMAIKNLAGLDQTRTVGPYDGGNFVIRSQGQFLSTTGTSSCATSGSGAAAYVRITSTVNWQANMKPGGDVNNVTSWAANSIRPPVKAETLITPRAGGTLLVKVQDQDGGNVPGATITVYGSKETESDDTSSEGCVVFGGLITGGYYIGALKSGYVDPNGNANPFTGATAGNGTTSPTPFQYGPAGSVTANFKTTVAGTTYTGQKAPSISWSAPGMTASQTAAPTTVPNATVASPPKLYPFNTSGNGTAGVYTDNYQVWAGNCDTTRPPTANASNATVAPATAAVLNDSPQPRVKVPGLVVKVSYATSGSYVTPDHVQLKDSCNEVWSILTADIRPTTDSGFANLGALDFPGQPYGTYTVCADYDPPGATPAKQVSLTSVPNTIFTAGNPAAVLITSTSTNGTCALS